MFRILRKIAGKFRTYIFNSVISTLTQLVTYVQEIAVGSSITTVIVD